ncbi:MAG: acyl carrier protein [bacterium]|nr:acyl carrier protein [bacterium]
MKTVEEILEKVLKISAKTISDSTKPEDIESWDSFNGLVLVTELEKNFNVEFSLDEIVSVKKVGDIKKILKRHGVNIHKNNSQ